MTKQELIQAAKEIRDICRNAFQKTGTWADCKKCPFYASPCIFIEYEDGQEAYPPANWDVEKLEEKNRKLKNWISRLDDDEADKLTQEEQNEIKVMLIELRELREREADEKSV